MIDIVIRDCGHGEWLPLIVTTKERRELYRGSRVRSPVEAMAAALAVWRDRATGNVAEFRAEHG